MKISDRTLNILKNFSTINNSILVKRGNAIDVISKEQNVVGVATIEETFPNDFAIYDLTRFLGAISLFDNPNFTFNSKSVRISSDDNKRFINYVYCDPKMVFDTEKVRSKLSSLPKPAFTFKLSNNNLQEMLKGSAILELPEFSVVGDGELLKLVVLDIKNPSSNTYSVDLGKANNEFRYVFKCQNLKLLPGNYNVSICLRDENRAIAIGYFKHDTDLSYYIVVEDVL